MSDVHPNVSRVVSAAKERGLEINTKRFPENGIPGQYSSTGVLMAGPIFLIFKFFLCVFGVDLM